MSWPEAFAGAVGMISLAAVLIALIVGEDLINAWREGRRK